MSNCTQKIAAGGAAVIGALMLSGCSAKLPFVQSAPNFDSTYKVCADIVYDDLTAKADVTRKGASEWVFSFTEPKQLNGVTLSMNAEGWSAKLGGLEFSAKDSEVYTLIPEVIGGSIDALTTFTTEDFTVEDGVLTADAEFEGKKVTVTAKERSGELISLKCPYHKLSVSFSGQQAYTPRDPSLGGLVTEEAE